MARHRNEPRTALGAGVPVVHSLTRTVISYRARREGRGRRASDSRAAAGLVLLFMAHPDDDVEESEWCGLSSGEASGGGALSVQSLNDVGAV